MELFPTQSLLRVTPRTRQHSKGSRKNVKKIGDPKMNIEPQILKIRRRVPALVLGVVLLTILGFARSSLAVPFTFTLTGVTFNDGATASGYFIFDPSTSTYGPFSITTTAGVSFTGSLYSPGAGTGTSYLSSPDQFIFDNFSIDSHYLVLSYSGHITGPGIYTLAPGTGTGPGSFSNSGEFVDASFDYRLITAGSLTVTPASVPESGKTLTCFAIGMVALFGFNSYCRRTVAA
jgi:hypothetical protein